MMNKFTTFSLEREAIEIIHGDFIKMAAVKLPDGVSYDPDFFYMKVRAVSAGERYGSNKNGDYFPEEELKKGYKTFLTSKAFKNHENKDVANAIGDVLSAEWDDKMKAVILFIRIDRKIAPNIVRGFEKGYMTDVSMGCRIDYSKCSICGNKAKVRSEYCTHINNMRHKVFDDGQKVFEINIGPKFHDISAVLNGAEKVAKVVGLYISGDKVAYSMESAFEKAASMREVFEKVASEEGNQKNQVITLTESLFDIDIPFEKCASSRPRKTDIQKIAELKKEIQGKITGLAKGEVIKERFEKAGDLRNVIRLLYTKYWDKSKCNAIANYIKDAAHRRKVPLRTAFNEFLQVLDFAGIELSPLEFSDIYKSTVGIASPDTRGLNYPDTDDNFIDSVDENIISNDIGDSVPSAFDTVKELIDQSDEVASRINGGRPLTKIKILIAKNKNKNSYSDDSLQEDMMNFVSPLMPDRSFHRKFLIARLAALPSEASDNRAHFMPALLPRESMAPRSDIIRQVLPMLLYSLYQGDRVRRFNNGDLDYGLNKFASYIEGAKFENILESSITKNASALGKGYTTRKALLYGLPLTFGYSALQRSRIRNNENVSGLNRYIAENPSNAYVLQAMGGPAIAKGIKSSLKKGKSKLHDVSDKYHVGPKEASESVYFEDMFKEASIDSPLFKKYNFREANMLKLAHLYLEREREDLAEETLAKEALSFADLDEYLQICKDSIKIEFEKEIQKTAGALKEIVLGALGGATFNKAGTSFLASAPAHIIDAAALTWLAKKVLDPKKKDVDESAK